jgi:uncharacterized protein YcbK (DUF882 family)
MIKAHELNRRSHSLEPEEQANLDELLRRLNVVREAYGKPMVVTNGYRTWAEHAAIYLKLGRKPPQRSAHLRCQAADVWDQDKTLWSWLMQNLALLEKVGLWLEDGSVTKNWVHFQSCPPASGRRIFLP